MTDRDLQSMTLDELHADRKCLDTVVRAVALSENISYIESYDRLAEAIGDWQLGTGTSVARMLEVAGVNGEGVTENVRLLDAAEGRVAVVRLEAQPTQLDTDNFGRVKLDQDYKGNPSVHLDADGKWLRDDPEARRVAEDRLRKARKLDSAFLGDSGRARWVEEDQLHLMSGVDLLKTLKQARKAERASQEADGVRRMLDAGIEADARHRAQRKELAEEATRVLERRKQLEQQSPADILRMLEHPGGKKSKGKKAAADPTELDTRVRERLRREGRPQIDYVICLEAEQRGDPMPPDRAGVKALDAPSGVHNHELNQRVLARIGELGRHVDRDYVVTLDEVLAEDSRRVLDNSPNANHGPLIGPLEI